VLLITFNNTTGHYTTTGGAKNYSPTKKKKQQTALKYQRYHSSGNKTKTQLRNLTTEYRNKNYTKQDNT
jgi:hypothetical protein